MSIPTPKTLSSKCLNFNSGNLKRKSQDCFKIPEYVGVLHLNPSKPTILHDFCQRNMCIGAKAHDEPTLLHAGRNN
jgi:hypothetical protein